MGLKSRERMASCCEERGGAAAARHLNRPPGQMDNPVHAGISEAYAKLDTNGDGKLDKDEFAKDFATGFHFTHEEANVIFDKWDMNKDGGLSVEEFSNIVGELHTAKQDAISSVMQEIQQEARDNRLAPVEEEISEEDADEILSDWQWGCYCCLCTLCLSWYPLISKLKTMEEELNARKAKERTMKQAIVNARNKLMEGPAATREHVAAELYVSRQSLAEAPGAAQADESAKI